MGNVSWNIMFIPWNIVISYQKIPKTNAKKVLIELLNKANNCILTVKSTTKVYITFLSSCGF